MNNDIKASVVSTTADVSVSEETFATTNTLSTAENETTQTAEKATVSKETDPLEKRIPKPKKKLTMGKIRRLFWQLILFRNIKICLLAKSNQLSLPLI